MTLISLNLEQPAPLAPPAKTGELMPPAQKADVETTAPTGASLRDIKSMEQFLIGLKTHSGQTVTPEKARRCSAVLACMRGITEDLSSLPIKVYKRSANGEDVDVEHNVHTLLNVAPNDFHTPIDIREHLLQDMMLWGHFYVLKNEDPMSPGDVSSIWPLQAAYVARRWREAMWTYSDPITGEAGDFTTDSVWRGTIMSSNSIDGIGLTTLAREAIGLLLAAEEQGARLFSYGVQSDLTLSTAEDLSDDEKAQLREAFQARHAGSANAFMPILLQGGLKADRIGLTAQESQYIEARKFQIEDIARVFRYPEVLLGNSTSGKSSTYASAEQFFQSYTKHTLTPWATRIEQTIHRDLLFGKDRNKYFVRHDFDSLLRGDTAARYASYSTGIASGFMSPAEVRRLENKPYVPGLDYFTRPLNTAAQAGKDAASVKPTDQSGSAPIRRLAMLVLKREHKALIGGKQDAATFYTTFGPFVSEVMGADVPETIAYLEMRRSDSDRFTLESQEKAIAFLTVLCKG